MEHPTPVAGAQMSELPKIDPEALYPDGELARMFGKSLESVRRFRKKHKIVSRFGRTPLTKGADIIRALETE
jgi:hypothetical protein